MTVEELQKKVDDWINAHGVRYFDELTNMALLSEEVGEVARIIARKYGEQSFKEGEEEFDLADELADVLFVLICLANQTGVNLSEAIEKNLLKKTKRDGTRHKRQATGKAMTFTGGCPKSIPERSKCCNTVRRM